MQLSVHQTWSEFVWQQNVSGYPRAQLQTLLSDVIHYGRGTHMRYWVHICSAVPSVYLYYAIAREIATASSYVFLLFSSFVINETVPNIYLVWIMHQWTIITLITNSITICIALVCIIDVRTIISFIKNV